jgi:uroporphyrinogen decarboxylase
MRPEQWQRFKKAAKQAPDATTPVALIVDSPWIPGYVGISHLDYYVDPELWFQANLRILREFPDIIFFPSWWVEYGMAIEPSALGSRIHFRPDRPPDQSPILLRLEDVNRLAPPNPQADGLMPFALQMYRMHKPRIFGAGYTIPVVAARGPLCLAAFLRGVNQLMTDLADAPEAVHKLLALTTRTVIDWLTAQAEVIGGTVEGILVLDDIVGFLSPGAYREFAHPYLKQICDAFPSGWVKVYHNDANVRPFLADLADTGFGVLNWSGRIDIREVREKTKGRLCPMGNVPPLEVGVRGTPEAVRQSAREIIARSDGASLILSVGGGVSPGMPAENLRALVEAARCAQSRGGCNST